jgi:hypothetical protein
MASGDSETLPERRSDFAPGDVDGSDVEGGPRRRRWKVPNMPGRADLFRAAARSMCAIALFGRFHRFDYLNPLAAPRMLVGDWVTYIVSANYLRSADTLTMPLGRLPGYLAPSGTMLGQTDSVPILTPLYRLANALAPESPVQLLGWMMLVAYVGVFLLVARFVHQLTAERSPWIRELLALCAAATLTIAPFWNLQYVHPALMQQWLLVWAAVASLRRAVSVPYLVDAPDVRFAGVAPVVVAAFVQPYLVPMAALIGIGPDLGLLRRHSRLIAVKWAVVGLAVLAVGLVSGFIAGSANLGSDGFGAYAADLLTVFDPDQQSRMLPDITTPPNAIGGYGYLGVGGLLLCGAGLCAALVRRHRVRHEHADQAEHTGRLTYSRPAAIGLMVSTSVATAFAVAPALRVGGRTVLDVSGLADYVASATAIFRVNGRFIWVVLWVVALWSIVELCRTTRAQVATTVFACSALLQLADVVPWQPILRSSSTIEYAATAHRLESYRLDGIASVQLQPPVVLPGCDSGRFGDITAIGDVLLAAAVTGMPINSGYTSRALPDYVTTICTDQTAMFARGEYDATVLYVLPAETVAPPQLTCRSLTERTKACTYD